jgi:hypothetical protein
LHAGYLTNLSCGCVALGVVVLVAVAAAGGQLTPPDRGLLALPLAVGFVAAIADPSGAFLYLHATGRHVIDALAAATAALAVATTFAGPPWRWRLWLLAIAAAGGTGIVTIVVVSNPGIDVWQLLQQSSTGLLHGHDMFRQHWVNSTGLQAVYPYLPLTTVLLAPFRWLFGDVRYGLLAATLVAAWLLGRRRPQTPPVAALLFTVPAWPLLVDRSWTEPLLILALAVTVLACRAERPGIAVVALAVALATKQPIVLLLPLFALWPRFGLRRTLVSIGLAVLAVLPWVIAGPRDFWHDAGHAELALGVKSDSLGLPGLLLRHGDRVGFWLLGLALLLGYAVVLARVPRTPSGLALGCAVLMAVYDFANKQTYFNHWQLPLGLIVIALAVSDAPAESPATAVDRDEPG